MADSEYLDALFHKYILNISNSNNPITYDVKNAHKIDPTKKLWAHLHCFDIGQFHKIYGPYMKTIATYANIIVTYSVGVNNINSDYLTVLQIPNKGQDIGAKFCTVRYLIDNGIDYEYVLFLHSKSCASRRKQYFDPLINNLQDISNKINDHDSYFPNIIWEWRDNNKNIKLMSGFAKPGTIQALFTFNREKNNLYLKGLKLYLKDCIKHEPDFFMEGNCFILKKSIIEKLYTKPELYNILNKTDDFDYNGYNLQAANFIPGPNILWTISIQKAFFLFKKELDYTVKLNDGLIEHTFERITLCLCNSPKIVSWEDPPR